MNKILKILLTCIFLLGVCIFIAVKYLEKMPLAPNDYQQTVNTGGELEKSI